MTAHADGWGQRGEASEPTPLEQPRDGGAPELQPHGNLGTRPALPAESVDPGHEAVRSGRGAPPRATGPIAQARDALRPISTEPFPNRRLADLEGRRDLTGAFPAARAPDDLFSTVWRRPGIPVHVHPSLPQCVDGCLATTSFAMGARVGLHNLVRLHN